MSTRPEKAGRKCPATTLSEMPMSARQGLRGCCPSLSSIPLSKSLSSPTNDEIVLTGGQVRFWSLADILASPLHVRFTPQKRTLVGTYRMLSSKCHKRTFDKQSDS